MLALKMVPLSRRAKWVKEIPEGVLALEKPSGLPSHPNRPGERSVILCPYDLREECYLLEGGRRLFLCNRLDSPTSGILILATKKALAREVKKAFRERRVEKTYLAAVRGRPPADAGVWKDLLRVERRGGQVRGSAGGSRRPGGVPLPVETRYELVGSVNRWGITTSLLRLFPLTGRTHQLRVQASHRKLPILGDKTYGDFELNRKLRTQMEVRRLMLHAWKIRLEGIWRDHAFVFEAETEVPGWCRLWSEDSNAGQP